MSASPLGAWPNESQEPNRIVDEKEREHRAELWKMLNNSDIRMRISAEGILRIANSADRASSIVYC